MKIIKKNLLIIVQARFDSSRFKGKVLKKIKNKSALEIIISRIKKSKFCENLVIATTSRKNDKKIIKLCKKIKVHYFKGDEKNVLKRFYMVAQKHKAKNIIRITADCPLVDYKLLDLMIKKYFRKKIHYLSNTLEPTYPDGLDIEIFSADTLKKAYLNAKSNYDKEHVTPYIKKTNYFKKVNFKNNKDLSQIRLTLDYREDFKVIKEIFNHFHPNIYFTLNDIMKLYMKRKNIFNLKTPKKKKLSKTKNIGQSYWKRATKIIPGGNMLLSKNPDRFLPGIWPTYYKKAKGCSVWDLSSKKYYDLSLMGVGTNILGYANKEIDNEVIKAAKYGNMSTLNCKEDILLAEKLLEINSKMDMVKFARTGGEASAIATRIARAASGRDNVAVCGYHGWHDWYLSLNLGDSDQLAKNLVPGIKNDGIPKRLKNSVFSFRYNDINSLEKIIKKHNIGCIQMEVQRNITPNNNFLKKVQFLAKKNKIILIFDECSSGFRETYGGLYKKYKLDPDMVIFGKALGNGYAITAILGKRNVMECSQKSFISSTFWTERIGPTAALKTLEIMKKNKSWKYITKIGKQIKKKWNLIADLNNLHISTWGLDALPGFSFKSPNDLKYRTFITQEMLKKGFLASNSVYCSTSHNSITLEKYYVSLMDIFQKINKFENERERVDDFLDGGTIYPGLNRMN
jgi:glutamate-1-semialdehyde aminotransferase/spore coat polysaccharide biosynthesis protein SpsF (cytidylyltransferase family)